jgi:hypothetical protein
VFIDSVNYIRITPEDVEDIKAENPQTAFITIQQATKNGNFRGSQEFAHNCDMVIRVEAGMASIKDVSKSLPKWQFLKVLKNLLKSNKPHLMGGESTGQMDLFSANDFSESSF